MKKLLIGFLAVGLIMGFAMTASAQPNIKASGQLYMIGQYVDNLNQTKGSYRESDNRANVANRLRMQFEIQVQEGLKLTTRFDAMERDWGQAQAVGGEGSTERNLSWERAYVTFNALYGVFDVGYQQSRVWGTCAFCDDFDSDAGIHYRYMNGPWTLGLEWEKRGNWSEIKDITNVTGEGSQQSSGVRRLTLGTGGTDNDHDVYHIYGIFRWATGQAGLRYELERDATSGNLTSATTGTPPASPLGQVLTRAPFGNPAAPLTDGYVITFHEISPYVQWTYGPFALEAELRYTFGQVDYDITQDVDREAWDIYVMGKYTWGPVYFGLEFAYVSGDDPNTTDKNESGLKGSAWDPLLMFGNYWFHKHQGGMGNPALLNTGAASNFNWYTINEYEDNMIALVPFVGYKVNPQLEVVAKFAWLRADNAPKVGGLPTGAEFTSKDYGYEFDIYANYKIFNNLTYTVGFGYFWTGDYFKGPDPNAEVDDNFLVMNALNLTF